MNTTRQIVAQAIEMTANAAYRRLNEMIENNCGGTLTPEDLERLVTDTQELLARDVKVYLEATNPGA